MCKDEYSTCKGTDTIDVMVGNKNFNRINGLQGSDYIIGLAGDDYIIGSNGSDSIMGGTGDDVLHGGRNKDAIMGGTGNDYITGGLGADEMVGRRPPKDPLQGVPALPPRGRHPCSSLLTSEVVRPVFKPTSRRIF